MLEYCVSLNDAEGLVTSGFLDSSNLPHFISEQRFKTLAVLFLTNIKQVLVKSINKVTNQ